MNKWCTNFKELKLRTSNQQQQQQKNTKKLHMEKN